MQCHQRLGIVGSRVRLSGRRGRRHQVAERAKTLRGFVVDRRGSRRLASGAQGEQASDDGIGVGPARLVEINLLPRIRRQVVELASGEVDDLEAPRHQSGQRRPVPREVGVERFEVHVDVVERPAGVDERPQTASVGGRGGYPHPVEHRGHHVDETCRPAQHARRNRRRRRDHERHAQGRVVAEEAVRALAVLAERLAVVAGDDDHRVRQLSSGAQRVEHDAKRRVGKGDLARVGIVLEARPEGLRWVVGLVRIVEMHPREPRGRGPIVWRADPPRRRVEHRRRGALEHRQLAASRA